MKFESTEPTPKTLKVTEVNAEKPPQSSERGKDKEVMAEISGTELLGLPYPNANSGEDVPKLKVEHLGDSEKTSKESVKKPKVEYKISGIGRLPVSADALFHQTVIDPKRVDYEDGLHLR